MLAIHGSDTIVITDVEHGIDDIIKGFYLAGQVKKNFYRRVRYTANGQTYINLHGKRYNLNDFIRVNHPQKY